jgi:hypothetical protein
MSKLSLIQTYRESDNLVDWLQRLVGTTAEIENWREVGGTNNPTFANLWVNFGSPHDVAGFYKDPYGIVRLKGHIKDGTGGLAAFTLPAEYITGLEQEFITFGTGGGGGPGPGGSDYAVIIIDASGDVIPDVNTGADVSLSGISFRVRI